VARLESLSCDAPLTGSGITITVDVPEGAFLSWDWAITLVNNAYSAGALGVSVNNVRLSPKWYVYYESGQLFVEGKALTSPFVFDIVENQNPYCQLCTCPAAYLTHYRYGGLE